jgi:hypothetical protein
MICTKPTACSAPVWILGGFSRGHHLTVEVSVFPSTLRDNALPRASVGPGVRANACFALLLRSLTYMLIGYFIAMSSSSYQATPRHRNASLSSAGRSSRKGKATSEPREFSSPNSPMRYFEPTAATASMLLYGRTCEDRTRRTMLCGS